MAYKRTEYDGLILEKEEHLATLTLNRPNKLNALPMPMRQQLGVALDEVSKDDDVRVLIVTGAGAGFCTGADVQVQSAQLAEQKTKQSRRAILDPIGSYGVPLAELQKPVIAAINGVAAGSGLSLAMFCDIRVASDKAKFAAVWVRRGLVPDVGASFFLTRLVGVDKALQLMYTGDVIDAREAERIGLVTRVVPHDSLMKVTRELAAKIASGPPIAIELAKRAVYRELISGLKTKLELESYAQNICYATEDHKEGVASFLEKREAHFTGH